MTVVVNSVPAVRSSISMPAWRSADLAGRQSSTRHWRVTDVTDVTESRGRLCSASSSGRSILGDSAFPVTAARWVVEQSAIWSLWRRYAVTFPSASKTLCIFVSTAFFLTTYDAHPSLLARRHLTRLLFNITLHYKNVARSLYKTSVLGVIGLHVCKKSCCSSSQTNRHLTAAH